MRQESAQKAIDSIREDGGDSVSAGADTLSDALMRKIANLEARIQALEAWKEEQVLDNFGQFDDKLAKRKEGRQEKLEMADLLEYRDGLVNWLEPSWPILAPLLLSAKTEQDILDALNCTYPEDPAQIGRTMLERTDIALRPHHIRMLQNPGILLEFLHSARYFRKRPSEATVRAVLAHNDKWARAAAKLPTRQIANALAGVPELSWRRSIERCALNPCNISIASASAQHFAQMYKLQAHWVQAVDASSLREDNEEYYGPFLLYREAETCASKLRAKRCAVRFAMGQFDERPDKSQFRAAQ